MTQEQANQIKVALTHFSTAVSLLVESLVDKPVVVKPELPPVTTTPIVTPDKPNTLAVNVRIPDQVAIIGEPFAFTIPANAFTGKVDSVDINNLKEHGGLGWNGKTLTIAGTPTLPDEREIRVSATTGKTTVVNAFKLTQRYRNSETPGRDSNAKNTDWELDTDNIAS